MVPTSDLASLRLFEYLIVLPCVSLTTIEVASRLLPPLPQSPSSEDRLPEMMKDIVPWG